MQKFESNKFLTLMDEKTKGKPIPSCPFCGGKKFSAPTKVAQIIIGENIDGLSIGPTIPSGMIICANCGHVEFFAVGVLGMLAANEKGGDIHAEQK